MKVICFHNIRKINHSIVTGIDFVIVVSIYFEIKKKKKPHLVDKMQMQSVLFKWPKLRFNNEEPILL